jgi:hypothetical protein
MNRGKTFLIIACAIGFIALLSSDSRAEVKWAVGGKMGLSIATGGGSTDAGFMFGPTGEVLFSKNAAISTEFTIHTQAGTPVIWANYFKYYFDVQGSKIRPYADGGFLLGFYTGGPYFGLMFGGGALFPIAKNLYIPADIQLGPVFSTPTRFVMMFTSGIRYEIP